ncbi:Thermosome subunit gamma [Cocos nucifera]|uniref:Thermosome subunit gamma n=1 Tax=Cocos nucifera TaxID=13894 RepID=A0A8K0IA42_COCNU|nr:Thermosome subunit gamma [Cocos nucifera]
MVSASLSFVPYSSSLSPFPSKSPFDASSVLSISFPRSLRIDGPLNPRPLLYSLSSWFSSSRRINYPKARVMAKLSAAIDDDPAGAEQFLENNSISAFMRFRKGEGGGGDGGGELQTAVVSHRKRFPWSLLDPFLQVDLISTIHIADKEYFETLQKGLELYDCVLYEMVTSRENLESRRNSVFTKRPKTSRSKGFNILGFIQRQMAQILSLDFQLDCLNYEGENWHHADLDYETFKLLQLERGESFFTFAKDMTLKSTKAFVQPASIRDDLGPWRSKLLWASRVLPMPLVGLFIISNVCAPLESQTAENPELEALSRLDFGAAMKIFLAKRLTSEFTAITAALEEKSVIIGERNRVATEALHRAIDCGNKRIAVLYGGGHMPDLGRRLREEFDMVPCGVHWITAWSIRNRELDSKSLPFLRTLAKLSGWPLNRYQTLALFIFSSVLALDLWFWELFFGTAVNWASWAASEINLFTNYVGHGMSHY